MVRPSLSTRKYLDDAFFLSEVMKIYRETRYTRGMYMIYRDILSFNLILFFIKITTCRIHVE